LIIHLVLFLHLLDAPSLESSGRVLPTQRAMVPDESTASKRQYYPRDPSESNPTGYATRDFPMNHIPTSLVDHQQKENEMEPAPPNVYAMPFSSDPNLEEYIPQAKYVNPNRIRRSAGPVHERYRHPLRNVERSSVSPPPRHHQPTF
jgi:hypothetical protein